MEARDYIDDSYSAQNSAAADSNIRGKKILDRAGRTCGHAIRLNYDMGETPTLEYERRRFFGLKQTRTLPMDSIATISDDSIRLSGKKSSLKSNDGYFASSHEETYNDRLDDLEKDRSPFPYFIL
jgi:hypothetical protein